MASWHDVYYEKCPISGINQVVFDFNTEADAKEFLRLAKIDKDVEDELVLYGDGVLRTMKRGKDVKRKGNSRRSNYRKGKS